MDPLYDAVSSGQADEVRRLILEEGADVTDCINDVGQTLLHLSVQRPHLEVSRVLLQAGADVDACDECMGYAPLHWAIFSGQEGQIRLLLNAGADVEAKDSHVRPLLLAVDGPDLGILLQAGADLAVVDKFGYTALHLTSKKCDVDSSRLLLDAGANVMATAHTGATPRHLATFHCQGHPNFAPEELQAMVALLEGAEQSRSTAFAMGLEERLGAASWVRALDPEVVRMVLELEREVVVKVSPLMIMGDT